MKKELDSTPGVALRIALIQRRLRYCDVIQSANKRLPADIWLTETALSKIITGRQRGKPEQADALAAVLGCPVEAIFPDLGKEVSDVRKDEPNRCKKCGKFCGETWGATDSDKMSKRAASLRCETCTCKALSPEEAGGAK